MSHLETIRAACIKANPEIVELKFGCELIAKGTHLVIVGMMPTGEPITVNREHGAYNPEAKGAQVEAIEGMKEFIGRPIRLADVLEAVKDPDNLEYMVFVDEFGLINRAFANPDGSWKTMFGSCCWNLLKDDLREQSPETLEFLADLFSAEK